MVRRLAHWLIVTYAILWFAIIAPGHQRGIIKVPGTEGGASCCSRGVLEVQRAPSCCAPRGEAGQSKRAPLEDRGRKCAVCYLNATLNLPVEVQLATPKLEFLTFLAPRPAVSREDVPYLSTYLGRAPPTQAA